MQGQRARAMMRRTGCTAVWQIDRRIAQAIADTLVKP
jgi:hypothetical protein